MEYLVGSLATLVGMLAILFVSQKEKSNILSGKYRIVYSQSHIYKILKPYSVLEAILSKQEVPTQARVYEKSLYIRVIVVEDQAYWIKDNTVFTADMVDDNMDNSSTRTVDTMGMDDVQLKKMMFIVEKLTEGGQDDRGNSGYSWI